MSSCPCGCHEVEARVEKLQSLLAMESHLDEEMDELERLYQLDRLKYEWFMREGYPDLCDVIKEQMQKTESLLRLYSPMLQDTCAEKEAHISHIVAMQRERGLNATRRQRLQHQQMRKQNVQRETTELIPERLLAQNALFQCHSVLNDYDETQNRHLQYLSNNTRPSITDPDSTKRKKEKLPSLIVEGQTNYENGFQKQTFRGMKRRVLPKILHKSKGWWSRKHLRYKISGMQNKNNFSSVSLQLLKAKAVCKRPMWKLGQFRHHRSLFSKGILTKTYPLPAKNVIKFNLKGAAKDIYERGASGQMLHVSAKTRQLLEVSLCDQKKSHTKRMSNCIGESLVSCNYTRRGKIVNKSKSLSGCLLSIPKTHRKERLPGQNPSPLPCSMPYDPLHNTKQNSMKSQRQDHDQVILPSNGTKNPNPDGRNNSTHLNGTVSGLLYETEMLTVSVVAEVEREEQNYFHINNYALPFLNDVDLIETDYVRD